MKPMNLVDIMNYAWDNRYSSADRELQDKVKNLISHAYAKYDSIYRDYFARKGEVYDDRVFYAFQRIFMFVTNSDGSFLQSEYDFYVKYCGWVGISPLSVDDCKALYARTSVDTVAGDIRTLSALRNRIDDSAYEAMIVGFCLLALLGDREFDENEYYIIRCFFEDGYDYCPATWEQFKKEW